MLKYRKHCAIFILFICFNILNCACSDNNDYPSTAISAEGYQEIKNTYNSILKIWPVPYESTYIKTSYGKTHIISWGKKNNPPLILFHGSGNSALIWIFIAKQLANNFYVIAPDTVGDVGLSVQTKPINNTHDYTEWFAELLNNMGLSKVNVAGISWGGGIALQTALKYPDRINRMVVMCPAWGIGTFRTWAFLHHLLPAVIFPGSETVRNLFEWLSVKRPAFADKERDAIVNYFIVALKNFKIPKLINPITFTDEELKQIQVPILLLIGDKEVIYSNPHAVIKRAKNYIPDINVKILPRAGHFLIYDRSDIIGNEILNFLQVKAVK